MDAEGLYLLSALLVSLGAILVVRRRRRKKVNRKCWVRPWIRRRDSIDSHNMLKLYKELLIDGDVLEFRSTLRMPPDIYHSLLDLLRSALTKKSTNFRDPISPEARLAVTLRYLALGDNFRSLSQSFRLGLSTVRGIVKYTCKAIALVMKDRYLRTPNTKEEWLHIASEFNRRWDFPNCLGAVDGKHIRITAPRKTGSYYHNYKDYFSIVLLAIVNSNYKFIYVDIGAEGKASDGGIWSQCSFQQHLMDEENPLDIPPPSSIPGIDEKVPYFLIGDDAFRLGPNLMKGFPGYGLNKREQIYNYRLSRARRIVENGLGIMTSRFHIFKRTIELMPETVSDIVMACCILHNYLRENGGCQYIPASSIDQELLDGNLIPGAWRQEPNLQRMQNDTQKNPSHYVKGIRNSLSHYFLTPQGEIPWQYRHGLL